MKTYWNNSGIYQNIADELSAKIPMINLTEDELFNEFIHASNVYYDYYNNNSLERIDKLDSDTRTRLHELDIERQVSDILMTYDDIDLILDDLSFIIDTNDYEDIDNRDDLIDALDYDVYVDYDSIIKEELETLINKTIEKLIESE